MHQSMYSFDVDGFDNAFNDRHHCPHGNGNWYDEHPTYSWDAEPKHYRTKYSHPYAYDAFFIHGDREAIKNSSADYTDRYASGDADKYKKALAAVGRKCRWDQMTHDELNKFVKAYYGKNFRATGLVEWCNQSSGYPLWSIHYVEKKPRGRGRA